MPIPGQTQPQSPVLTPDASVSTTKLSEGTSYGTPDPLKMKLQQKFAQIQNKKGALEIQKYINKNKLTELKTKVLREIFTSLQDMGVDLTDPESIAQFLQKLESQDPQLVELFESALNNIAPGDTEQTGGNALADRYANLQQRVGA